MWESLPATMKFVSDRRLSSGLIDGEQYNKIGGKCLPYPDLVRPRSGWTQCYWLCGQKETLSACSLFAVASIILISGNVVSINACSSCFCVYNFVFGMLGWRGREQKLFPTDLSDMFVNTNPWVSRPVTWQSKNHACGGAHKTTNCNVNVH